MANLSKLVLGAVANQNKPGIYGKAISIQRLPITLCFGLGQVLDWATFWNKTMEY